MDVKEAIKAATDYVADLFHDQLYARPALEEVEQDDRTRVWNVVVGFLRLPDKSVLAEDEALLRDVVVEDLGLVKVPPPFVMPRRVFKVVQINDADGRILAVRDRDR